MGFKGGQLLAQMGENKDTLGKHQLMKVRQVQRRKGLSIKEHVK